MGRVGICWQKLDKQEAGLSKSEGSKLIVKSYEKHPKVHLNSTSLGSKVKMAALNEDT